MRLPIREIMWLVVSLSVTPNIEHDFGEITFAVMKTLENTEKRHPASS